MIETTYTHARANLADILDKAVHDRQVIIVHRKNQEDAAIIAADDLRALQETAYLLSSPANASRLLSALDSSRTGQGKIFPSVAVLADSLGLTAPDEGAE